MAESFKLMRFDIGPAHLDHSTCALNRIGDSAWLITGLQGLEDVVLRESPGEHGGMTLRNRVQGYVVHVDEVLGEVAIAQSEVPPSSFKIYNRTARPGSWLVNAMTVVLPNGSKEEFARVTAREWNRRSVEDINVRLIDRGEWLDKTSDHQEIVLCRDDGARLVFDLLHAKVALQGPGSDIGVAYGDLETYSKSPTPWMITEFSVRSGTSPASVRTHQFRKVGPVDWVHLVDGKRQKALLVARVMDGLRIALSGDGGDVVSLWRGHIEGKTDQIRIHSEGADGKLLSCLRGVETWRAGPAITSRSALAEDVLHHSASGKPTGDPRRPGTAPIVYRTTVSLPLHTRYIDVWTSEETDIEVDQSAMTLDPEKTARVVPLRRGRLNLAIAAKGHICPAIYLRTSGMRPSDRPHVIHPDVELHKTMATLPPGKLKKARAKGHLPAGMSDEAVEDLQTALQNLARSVQYTHNATASGVHHDRFLHPPNMVHPHFELSFAARAGSATAKPLTYRPLGTEDVHKTLKELRSHPSFNKVRGMQAAQSWADIWNDIRHAATVVVHTVEKIGGDIVDTGKHIVKDAEETIHNLGEHIVRGDVVGGAKDLWEGGEHIAGDLGKGVGSVVSDGFTGVGQVLIATVKVVKDTVESVYEFVIHNTGFLGQALDWLVTKAGGVVGRFLRAFLDPIGWEDVLHTQAVLVDTINDRLDGIVSVAETLKSESDAFFQKLVGDNDKAFDHAIRSVIGSPRQAQTVPPACQSGAMDALEWILGKLVFHSAGTPPIPVPALQARPGQMETPGDEIARFIQDNFGTSSQIQSALLDNGFRELSQSVFDFQRAPQHLLAAVLEVVRDSVDFGFEAVAKLLDMVIDLFEAAIKGLKTLINQPIVIPVLSDFYRGLTGKKDLTILSLTALIVAVPMTVLSKAILGRRPFPMVAAGQEAPDAQTAQVAKDWAIAYGSLHLILGVLSPAEKVKEYAARVEAIDVDLSNFNLSGAASAPMSAPADRASMGVFEGIFRVLTAGTGFFAQYAGSPIVPGTNYRMPLPRRKHDRLMAPTYWAHVVWWVQWPGYALGVYTSASQSVLELAHQPQGKVKLAGDIVAAVTSAYGIAHTVLMGLLHQADLDKRDFLDGLMTGRSGHPKFSFGGGQLDKHNDVFPPGAGPVAADYFIYGARRGLVVYVEAALLRQAEMDGVAPQDRERLKFADQLSDYRSNDQASQTTREWLQDLKAYYDFSQDVTVGNGLPNKLFANLMDCLPEVGAMLAAPRLVEASDGITLAVSAAFDVFGHFAEGTTHLVRLERGHLL